MVQQSSKVQKKKKKKIQTFQTLIKEAFAKLKHPKTHTNYEK
jgi:hypothetical protein